MIKLIAAAVLLMAGCAVAQDIFVMPNKGGGEIVLTGRVCKFESKTYDHLREAYSHFPDGVLQGCWHIKDGMIEVIWNVRGNAERRMYNFNDFQQRKTL